jgi:hypothetical protein
VLSRKYTLTVTEDMHKRLEEERKRRFLHSISETIRMIVSEYLSSPKQELSTSHNAERGNQVA